VNAKDLRVRVQRFGQPSGRGTAPTDHCEDPGLDRHRIQTAPHAIVVFRDKRRPIALFVHNLTLQHPSRDACRRDIQSITQWKKHFQPVRRASGESIAIAFRKH
jgi:hypothetical protein